MTINESQLLNEAVQHHQAGRLSEAESRYRQILAANPRHADALGLLGMVALQSNQPGEAANLLEQSISISNRNPSVLVNHGLAMQFTGKITEAEQSFRRAVKLEPKMPDAQANLGLNLSSQGQFDEAVKHLRRAAQLVPQNPDYKVSWAAALMQSSPSVPGEAEKILREVLEQAPGHPAAQYNLAAALFELERVDDSDQELTKAEAVIGDDPELMDLRARIEYKQGKVEQAIATYTKALGLAPKFKTALVGLANLYLDQDQPSKAADYYRIAIQHFPDDVNLPTNLALAVKDSGDFAQAVDLFEQQLKLSSDDHATAATLAITQFALGNFDVGLDGFERRWRREDERPIWRPFKQPLCTQMPAPGETILVWGEQGIGDQLLFASFVGDLTSAGANCVIECDPRLVSTFERSFSGTTVVGTSDPPDARTKDSGITAHLPMGSLLSVTKPWERPRPTSYVTADSTRADEFGKQIGAAGNQKRIGISWRSARQKVGPLKSMPLELWAPILEDRAARFVNLQYGDTDEEIAQAIDSTGADLLTIPSLDRFQDIDGLLALVSKLDLVITTSNVTAHYAAVLGVPCWLALRRSPIWYWGIDGKDVPFYPSIRAYRQPQAGDWASVIEALAADLSDYLQV